jgi:predicted MPP superfamily phosphohydrolase
MTFVPRQVPNFTWRRRAWEGAQALLMRSDWPAELASRFIPPSIVVRQQTFALPKSLGSTPTMRIGFASDFHAGPTTPLKTIELACAALRDAAVDLILLGGDFVSLRGRDAERLLSPLREVEAPLGKFAVLGNHDLWSNPEPVLSVLERADIHHLHNAGVRLPAPYERTMVAGLDDHLSGAPDASRIAWDPTLTTLLLIHQPTGILDAAGRPFDLAFAGHTHAGQVVLPGGIALVVPDGALSRQYLYGPYKIGPEQHLLVSGGVGNSTIPIRLGVPPEVVICTVNGPADGSPHRPGATD